MSSEVQSPTTSAPPTRSIPARYRTVKRTSAAVPGQTSSTAPPPPAASSSNSNSNGPSRLPSRYRRGRPVLSPAHAPAVPSSAPQFKEPVELENPFQTPPRPGLQSGSPPSSSSPPPRNGPSPRDWEKQAGKPQRETSRWRGKDIANIEDDRSPSRNPVSLDKSRQDAEDQERLERLKREDLERLQKALDASNQKPPRSPDKLRGFFSQSRKDKDADREVENAYGPRSGRKSPKKTDKDDTANGHVGAESALPGADAPMSAVNAGERRVLVRCGKASINLPITPITTPMDLIYSAANCLSLKIEPTESILLESVMNLGIERPVRKYEHIRDVMNSWDRDTQNPLLLVPSTTPGSDADLETWSVPKQKPGQTAAALYYSCRPRKWEKLWIVIRQDGQIVWSKKESASKEKDFTPICHLSDFDIYSPTDKQMSVLRCPKEQCFAIKSQQKSSMFLDTAKYVHFFATNDRQLASDWYKAVQQWRSWYLINKMGVTETAPESFPSFGGSRSSAEKSRPKTSKSTAKKTDENLPYTLGSFKPLLNLEDLMTPPTIEDLSPSTSESKAVDKRQRPTRERKPPPSSYKSGKVTKDRSASNASHKSQSSGLLHNSSQREQEQTVFAPGGLLGRTYSQLQKTTRERELSESRTNGPFIDGPNLLNGGTSNDLPNSSVPSMETHSAPKSSVHRNKTIVEKPKPLVDLDDVEHREPPQHLRKGRGYTVSQVPPGGLIECATTSHEAIVIPSSGAWNKPHVGRTRTLTASHARPKTAANPFQDPVPAEAAFTGLLARAGESQGGTGRGHGVMSGAHAKGPMLDMSAKSVFVQGSLLSRVEQLPGSQGPIIDREKTTEVIDK